MMSVTLSYLIARLFLPVGSLRCAGASGASGQ